MMHVQLLTEELPSLPQLAKLEAAMMVVGIETNTETEKLGQRNHLPLRKHGLRTCLRNKSSLCWAGRWVCCQS